jgi:hypothetical protein
MVAIRNNFQGWELRPEAHRTPGESCTESQKLEEGVYRIRAISSVVGARRLIVVLGGLPTQRIFAGLSTPP